MTTALLAGATGLIGQQLLPKLLNSSHYDQVIVLSRRPLDVAHERLRVIETSFDELAIQTESITADDIYCCLGTTQKSEGGGQPGRDGMLKVDRDYVLTLARCFEGKAQQFLVVSALAANANSSVFYNRVKGEMEQGLMALNYPSLHIFRPSLLLGDRQQARPLDPRGGEAFWQKTMPIFNGLMAGKFSRYRPTPATRVADDMLAMAIKAPAGQQVYHFYRNHTGA